jgi:hypothetical protein
VVADAEGATAACRGDVRVNTVRELPLCRSLNLMQCDVNELGRDKRRAERSEADIATRTRQSADDTVRLHKDNESVEQELLPEMRVYEIQGALFCAGGESQNRDGLHQIP